jgi:hypothetical protein
MFCIDTKTFAVKRVTSKQEAQALGNAYELIKSEEDLKGSVNFTASALIHIYNGLSDKPVTKFQDRATAVRRVWGALLAVHPKETAVVEEPVSVPEAPKSSESAPQPQATPAKGKRGRAIGSGKMAGKMIIAKRTTNPRRPGTHGFASYEILLANPKGIRYEDYRAAGGRANDLGWDLARNYVEVR